MNIKKLTIFTFLILTIFSGCDQKEKIAEDVVVEEKKSVVKPVEQKAPAFEFTTVSGKPINIVVEKDGWKFAGLEDKVILMNFFGTWCPPCKAEIPHLNNIRSKLEKDFEVLAVDIGQRDGTHNSKEHLEAFIKEFNVSYPIVSGEESRKLFSVVGELNTSGSIPFMVLFNKQGQYVRHYIGMKPEEMLFNDISATIEMK